MQEDEKKIPLTPEEPLSEESERADMSVVAPSAVKDLVKAYLKEMGAVRLLKREEEVRLAKTVEQGMLGVARELFKTRVLIEEINSLNESLLKSKADDNEGIEYDENEVILSESEAVQKEVLFKIDEVEKLYEKKKGGKQNKRDERPPEALLTLFLDIDKRSGLFATTVARLTEYEGEFKRLHRKLRRLDSILARCSGGDKNPVPPLLVGRSIEDVRLELAQRHQPGKEVPAPANLLTKGDDAVDRRAHEQG